MNPADPDSNMPAPVRARNSAKTLLGLTGGIAVLVAALVMAYHASTTAAASGGTSGGRDKTGVAFAVYATPRALPNLRFTDANGRAMTLQAFRGKFVLLNIWATWCPPCRREMPTLDRLQTKLGGPNFEVVALSIDRGGPFVVKTFFDEVEIKALRIYVDSSSGAVADNLGAAGIPVTLLIDREGREIGRKLGPAEWDSAKMIHLMRGYIAAPASNSPGGRNG